MLHLMSAAEIQILGTRKCKDTKKAMMFFSDRGVKYHFRDLSEKMLSLGEMKNLSDILKTSDLIDKNSREYEEKGFRYREYDPQEEALGNWKLVKTPIVRWGRLASLGYVPEEWSLWLGREE